MQKIFDKTFVLRAAVSVVLLMHSIPSIVTGAVNEFGTAYLDQVGFAPVGLPLAWAIKLSHIAAAVCFILKVYVKPAGVVTLIVLIAGIIMIHRHDGWFVVGGGRNGVEFNFLMMAAIITIMMLPADQSKVMGQHA